MYTHLRTSQHCPCLCVHAYTCKHIVSLSLSLSLSLSHTRVHTHTHTHTLSLSLCASHRSDGVESPPPYTPYTPEVATGSIQSCRIQCEVCKKYMRYKPAPNIRVVNCSSCREATVSPQGCMESDVM